MVVNAEGNRRVIYPTLYPERLRKTVESLNIIADRRIQSMTLEYEIKVFKFVT
jgi:hypothetical protein